MGASLIALLYGGTVQSAIIYITPFMFGAEGDGTADDTAAIRTAISVAKSLKYSLDLRGGSWFITGTLDFTGLRMVLSDANSKIWVDSTNFTSSYTAVYAITIGSPDDDYATNRASGFSLVGFLNLGSQNRTSVCNGIFIKTSNSHMGYIRVSGFNGEGVKLSATWDTVIDSISCELCGNTSSYQFSIVSGGDTSNCLNIGRIQSEQAYHKCLYIACIRSGFGPIHAERTYITTADDGTSGILSGLNYINFYINAGNSHFSQIIHDCATSGTAPDGTALAAIIPSVVLNIDFGSISSCSLITSYVTTSFGRDSTYNTIRCVNWWFDSTNCFGCTVNSPYVTGVLYPAFKTTYEGGYAAQITARFNASDLVFNGMEAPVLTFPNTLLGDIYFKNMVRFPSTFTLGTTQTPSGYSGQSTLAETRQPVTFENCKFLGTVTGAYQSRAKFRDCYIAAANMASRAAVDFVDTTFGTFAEQDTNNRGYTTVNCRCNSVTSWGTPNEIYYHGGTKSERLGTGTGFIYRCDSGSTLTWSLVA